jgi:acyl-coenzyme A thioesterase PaaI-like protein
MSRRANAPADSFDRTGPFWDVMEGRAPPPPAAKLLGFELVRVDPQAGTIEVAFTASERFLNPAGVIQGGLLATIRSVRR